MQKLFVILPALVLLVKCGTMDFTAPLEGKFDNVTLAPKSFVIIGTVSVSSTETHRAGPLGFVKSVEGAKVTYADLMQEAARLNADDIIDVRIEMNTTGDAGFIEWLKGWERTFTHTGQAIAIRYVSGGEDHSDLPNRQGR